MQHQGSAQTREGLVVASGYGLKLYVLRGHLVIEDGRGRDRRTRRLNRATSGLKRLIVLGHTGFVTLEALRWIRDVGAVFVQIDSDGSLIAISAAERFHNTKLRRAQVLAAESEVGLSVMKRLVGAKLDRQAEIAARLAGFLRDGSRFGYLPKDPIPEVIDRQRAEIAKARSLARLRSLEAVAGRWYWHTLAHAPVRFDKDWRRHVPEHWHYGGLRTSPPSGFKSSRKAATPLHAFVNYAYAVLETEATIVLQEFGFDPSLGLMHTDKRYRGSLATDLIEPVRPVADEAVLELIADRELRRGDIYETREGVCRLGPPLARELADRGLSLREALTPHAAELAKRLLGGSRGRSAAPPARRRGDQRASGKGGRRAMAPRYSPTP